MDSKKDQSRDTAISIIAPGTELSGRLESSGLVKIEGRVIGGIRAEHQVLVARGGFVEGDILTKEAIIGGEVNGSILADHRIEVQETAVVNGDIQTEKLVIAEGGEVNGHVKMGNPNALAVEADGTGPALSKAVSSG